MSFPEVEQITDRYSVYVVKHCNNIFSAIDSKLKLNG
jgi:hypothetical protein